MKYKELEKKSKDELLTLGKELREELFMLKIKNRTLQLDDKSKVRKVRRDIARVQMKLSNTTN